MSCLHTVIRYPPAQGAPSRRYVTDPDKAGGPGIETPCGACPYCYGQRVDGWARRMLHEAKTSGPGTCHFVTNTYSSEAIQQRRTFSLSLREHQLYVKRVRKRFGKHIRFAMCAEYGSMEGGRTGRPHFHYCFFNLRIPDLTPASPSKSGMPQWRSAVMEELWGNGMVWIGTVTEDSCRYIASYIMKRLEGPDEKVIIRDWVDDDTGEVVEDRCIPQFGVASRGGRGADGVQLGGLGSRWFRANKMDCFPADFLWDRIAGRKYPVPKGYRRYLSDEERLEVGERAMARARERDAREIELHRPPDPLRYPGLLNGGHRLILMREIQRGNQAKATAVQKGRRDAAEALLKRAEERVVLSDVVPMVWSPARGRHLVLGPSPAAARDAAILKARKLVKARMLKLKLERRKREL